MPTMHDTTHALPAPPRAVLCGHALHDAAQPAETAASVALFRAAAGT
jgi:hypothetical protein